MVVNAIREFLRTESSGGMLLLAAAILAMLLANSAGLPYYVAFLSTELAVKVGEWSIAKPLLLWINDGLMAVFFFLVGLELKRELLEGELSQLSQVILPAAAAVGGMAVPAAIYVGINWGDPVTMSGWAIPAATDIAFALGVLALLGKRVPIALKVFLMTLAILDDVGAIVIIAIFYTTQLSTLSLTVAGAAFAVLVAMNRRGVMNISAYLLVGMVMWVSVLQSGVHATLAGVALAFIIPLAKNAATGESPLRRLEHDLHPPVAYVILPLFAFANAGVPLAGVTIGTFLTPVPLGISAGLFFGKQIGILATVWLVVVSGLASLPKGVRWIQIWGAAALCGIGFTMSLFIGSLAFEHAGQEYAANLRLGIIFGSLLSALVGYGLLRYSLRGQSVPQED